MLHLNLICLGSLKEKFWQAAETEYLKRLQAWVKIEIRELKEESFSAKDDPQKIKEKEAEKIIKELEKNKPDYLITLSHLGKQFSSKDLSEHIKSFPAKQLNNITFVIGGPLGLSETILQKANLKLSLSPLTFTHQMARVILWEQIYRSLTIINNRSYHY